jgi:small-conductance mechanosensitive channel
MPALWQSLHPWLRGSLELVALWAAGWLAWRLLRPLLRRLTSGTRTQYDDFVLEALQPWVPLWCVLGGMPIVTRHALLPAAWMSPLDRIAEFLVYLTLSLALASVVSRFVAHRAGPLTQHLPATTLTQNAIRIGIVVLGAILGLSNIGIAVTPVLTALGVGSLAVALALQPTLTNLVAGFNITFARQVRVGDIVELEQGQMGEVLDIGWRTTTLRELANNLITIPNARMAELIVRNFSLPSPECALVVPVGVSYTSDLDEVERVVLEVATAVQSDTPGAVPEFTPLVRYMGFAESAVQFQVILQAASVFNRMPVQSAFHKALHQRFRSERIEIPFPQRVVHVQSDHPGAAAVAARAE